MQAFALKHIIESRSSFRYPAQIIHLFTGGSAQHGARLSAAHSDLDVCGIYLQTLSQLTAMRSEQGHVSGTSDQHVRNQPGDEDYTLKTLREWAVLAARGNPTMLGYLFTNPDICDPACAQSVWFSLVVPQAHLFASRAAGQAFLGYGLAQFKRLHGLRGTGKHGQRDELVATLGFDGKAAMHMLRMMGEGIEFMRTGTITYPRPDADFLVRVRKGQFTLSELTSRYLRMEQELKTAIDTSELPQSVNQAAINQLLLDAHVEGWR